MANKKKQSNWVMIIIIAIILLLIYIAPKPPTQGLFCCRITTVTSTPVTHYEWTTADDCSDFKDGNLVLGARHLVVGNSYCQELS